jgi:hypothetical protein
MAPSRCRPRSYAERTAQNVRDSDATLWFGSTNTAGAKATLKAVAAMSKPGMEVYPDGMTTPTHVAAWLDAKPHIKVLNVAGNRESKAPGIGARVERFLSALFRRLGHERAE